EIRKHRARPAVIHFQSDSFFEVCPILDSNRDLEVYRDVSYSEVVMRTILPFIFAAWIVMPTVSCAQVGKDFTSPGQLAPGVSQKAVLEASLGNPTPVGWKLQVQGRARPRVVEVTVLPGARQDLTPRERQINYVLEGVMTRRVGDQVLRYEPSSVLELPIGGIPFTASNESAMPMRFLVVDLVPVPASASAPP